MNPSHYSYMRFCGSILLTHLQMHGGGNTYCYPRVRLGNGRLIEYGTISEGDFCYDLNHWSELYVSGHLHKPVETIVEADSEEVASAIENNIQSAIRAALLMLPEKFSFRDFFIEIGMCAYNGKQFRPNRAKNLEVISAMVDSKLEDYYHYYLPHLKRHFLHCIQLPDQLAGIVAQNKTEEMIREHFHALPSTVVNDIFEHSGAATFSPQQMEQYIQNTELLERVMRLTLSQILGRTYRGQDYKDLITASLPNAITKIFSNDANRTS